MGREAPGHVGFWGHFSDPGSSRSLKLGANGLYFLGTQPGSLTGVKSIPQDRVWEERTHSKLMKKGWRPAATGSPLQGCH